MTRKVKSAKKEDVVVSETPVVFSLKILDEDTEQIIPAGESVKYSDILLSSTDVLKTVATFNTDLLKSVLDKVVVDRYTSQTSCFWC